MFNGLFWFYVLREPCYMLMDSATVAWPSASPPLPAQSIRAIPPATISAKQVLLAGIFFFFMVPERRAIHFWGCSSFPGEGSSETPSDAFASWRTTNRLRKTCTLLLKWQVLTNYQQQKREQGLAVWIRVAFQKWSSLLSSYSRVGWEYWYADHFPTCANAKLQCKI